MSYKKHILLETCKLSDALLVLNSLKRDAICFVVKEGDYLIGSLTDGDIRRALIDGKGMDSHVVDVIQNHPKYIDIDNIDVSEIKLLRESNYMILPIIEGEAKKIKDVLNLRIQKSLLPIDVFIMAGGKGTRLLPLTHETPKPLLPIGGKPIISYTLNRLSNYGIHKAHLSVNYLADKLDDFSKKWNQKNKLKTTLLIEPNYFGTIGSLSLVEKFYHNTILVCNSDLLTDINLEEFYLDFINNDCEMSIASIPYYVDVPYAVMDSKNNYLRKIEEKPRYTYYSNGGIYLMKKQCVSFIPKNAIFSATDLIDVLIQKGKKIRTFSHHGYWLDIGKHEDYMRAQNDIKTLSF